MTRYDRVERVLEKYPEARDDGVLCYCLLGYIKGEFSYQEAMSMYEKMQRIGNPWTVRRLRQKIQNEIRPDLGPSAPVAKKNNEIEQKIRATKANNLVNEGSMYTKSTKHDLKFV